MKISELMVYKIDAEETILLGQKIGEKLKNFRNIILIIFGLLISHIYYRYFLRVSALSVFSQGRSRSRRPKWPYAAVCL